MFTKTSNYEKSGGGRKIEWDVKKRERIQLRLGLEGRRKNEGQR